MTFVKRHKKIQNSMISEWFKQDNSTLCQMGMVSKHNVRDWI